MKTTPDKNHKSNQKKALFILSALFLALLVGLTISEVLLRFLPIPGIEYNTSKYDPLVGEGQIPGSTVIYRNERDDHTRRKNNQWGYLDKEHDEEKKAGVYRIGFFGDSYTRAKQVPLETTFFRLIEADLQNYDVECLAFGNSGFGTLQSYLNSQRWADFFDLDMVVYVLVENDLGDQVSEIKRKRSYPYPILTKDGFEIDNTFQKSGQKKASFYYNAADFLTSRFLVFATISQRLKLLLKHGVKFRVTDEDRAMNSKSNKTGLPDENDFPSTWPDSLRNHATKLAEAVISKWREEAKQLSKKFVILYVPRASEWKKETQLQDSWKAWLVKFCNKNEIDCIDPKEAFQKADLQNKELYYDHFTPDGHRAFADSFVQWFQNEGRLTAVQKDY